VNKKEMLAKLAKLETINDQLLSEIEYLDLLVRQIGFEEGLSTLKSAALELLQEQDEDEPPFAM